MVYQILADEESQGGRLIWRECEHKPLGTMHAAERGEVKPRSPDAVAGDALKVARKDLADRL